MLANSAGHRSIAVRQAYIAANDDIKRWAVEGSTIMYEKSFLQTHILNSLPSDSREVD